MNNRLLSSQRVSFIIIFAFSIIIMSLHPGVYTSILFYCCLLAPVLSFLHALILKIGIRFDQEMDVFNITRGQSRAYRFMVTNKTLLPVPRMRISFVNGRGLNLGLSFLSILPFGTGSAGLNIDFPHRGRYDVGAESVYVWGCFSLVSLRLKGIAGLPVYVYPKCIKLERLCETRELDAGLGGYFRKNQEEIFTDTRKYQYGDPMNRVHWKLSARQGELISKLYENESTPENLFILDLRPVQEENRLNYEDFIIELCFAVISYCLENQREIKLAYAQEDKINLLDGSGEDSFSDFLEALTMVSFNAEISPKAVLENAGEADICYAALSDSPESGFYTLLSDYGSADIFHLSKDTEPEKNYKRELVNTIGFNIDYDIKALLEGKL